jgi:hypothetical protein
LRGKITNKRGTPTSCVIPKTNPTREYLQELLTKIPRKSSEKQQKGKTGETTNNLEESCSIFYTCQERFIHGLACLPIIHPSLKISPWSSQASPIENPKENRKGKMRKQMSLGSKRWLPSSLLYVYMEATKR